MPGPRCLEPKPRTSNDLLVVLDGNDVPVPDHVVFRLLAHQTSGLDLALAAQSHEVSDGHRLSSNEALGEVGVNARCRLERSAALSNQPGADLFLSRSEKQHLA